MGPSSFFHISRLATFFVCALLCAPVVSLFLMWGSPQAEHWQHLFQTQFFRYVFESVVLAVLVLIGAGSAGIFAGYCVARFDFPGRSFLESALLLPFAVPAYLTGYVFVHLFQFGGPLHLQLMDFWKAMGWGALTWSSPRNIFCAALVLSFSLFPYVYALSLVAFRGVPATLEDAARSLGKSKSECFLRITLVMAGPQIVAALALVFMEVMADFGTIETLTVGVYRAWFGLGSLAMAAQLSTFLLGLVAAVMFLRSFF
jgi:iron(III) transport system permease protein